MTPQVTDTTSIAELVRDMVALDKKAMALAATLNALLAPLVERASASREKAE